jgi:hypothetical protein
VLSEHPPFCCGGELLLFPASDGADDGTTNGCALAEGEERVMRITLPLARTHEVDDGP